MNIQELEKRLIEINIPKDAYSILYDGLPNERYCITKSHNIWEVYYSERGSKSGLKTFHDEGSACQYFFNMIEKYAKYNK